jgi:formyltetrahydrofolate hydrolase
VVLELSMAVCDGIDGPELTTNVTRLNPRQASATGIVTRSGFQATTKEKVKNPRLLARSVESIGPSYLVPQTTRHVIAIHPSFLSIFKAATTFPGHSFFFFLPKSLSFDK